MTLVMTVAFQCVLLSADLSYPEPLYARASQAKLPGCSYVHAIRSLSST